MAATWSSCIVELSLTSHPVFGTDEFGMVRAWNLKCVDAFMYFCVCVDYDHGCALLCLTHTQTNLYTLFFIFPNLNQINTVLRVGRGHLKVCKMQVTPPF